MTRRLLGVESQWSLKPTSRDLVLAAVAGGRDNNFNLIRMIAATGVLVSHAYPLTIGSGTAEPLQASTGLTLGTICVVIFFAISGFLIARSFERARTRESWISARIMRLFPALIMVTMLAALALGPAVTDLPQRAYFSAPGTYVYIPKNITLVSLQFDLPGVFLHNPTPEAVNGSLWTLRYEVACYLGVYVLGIAGLLSRRTVISALFVLYAVAFVATDRISSQLPLALSHLRFLSFPFALGVVFHVLADKLRLRYSYAIVALAFAWISRGSFVYEAIFLSAVSYTTFVLAYLPAGIMREYNRLGDYSYGMYVYAYPVQQTVAWAGIAGTVAAGILVSFPIALICAVASWHFLEKPALAEREAFAGVLRRLAHRRLADPAG